MDRQTYQLLENFMLSSMEDSAHDREHVYRVLYQALQLAQEEETVDFDVLIAACLLHDIGRSDQLADPSLCHALVGGDKAFRFLTDHGFPEEFALRVKECIVTHRFRADRPPTGVEAKLLFDADKLDVTGAMGVARTLLYQGTVGSSLYSLRPDGSVSSGEGDSDPSFFREYQFKLKRLYDRFCTPQARRIALSRQAAAEAFYRDLLQEAEQARSGRMLAEQLTQF